ncbi:MAG: phosphodiester glycosidase family protein [Muribaculaceae bacterium]|nr:phosphodiester glycosidase family protein [Muribaculaceae bacterium]
MRRRYLLTLLLAVAVNAPTATARDQWVISDKAYDVDTLIYPHLVGPGVTSAKFDIPALPLKVCVTEMDLTNPYIVMETCMGSDQSWGVETPPHMVTRKTRSGHEVVAAVNGDFFKTSPLSEIGIPLSGQVSNGELLESTHNVACLVMDSNHRPHIDRLRFSGQITHGDDVFTLNLVNRLRFYNEDIASDLSVLFTPSFGLWTYYGASTGKMVLLRPAEGAFRWKPNGIEQCVVDTVFDAKGMTTIPDGKAILWLKGTYAEHAATMQVGDQLSVSFSLSFKNEPGDVEIQELIGSSNDIIMQNGVLKEDWQELHPRTAIGFNADTTRLYFVVVDGRQDSSIGATLKDMMGIFLALGAANAINMDGGGSSCMVVNGDVINQPSDGSIRPVGNGCLVVSTAPADDQISIIGFEPRCYTLTVTTTASFGVWGYNQYGVLRSRNLQGCTFTCDPQVGTFDDTGMFQAAAKPASGNLYVTYNGITATQPVTIKKLHIKGDVNDDDKVDIDDVITLIDFMLGIASSPSTADVNSDGRVNIDDITELIDLILEK